VALFDIFLFTGDFTDNNNNNNNNNKFWEELIACFSLIPHEPRRIYKIMGGTHTLRQQCDLISLLLFLFSKYGK
jgi:hypothetical protein